MNPKRVISLAVLLFLAAVSVVFIDSCTVNGTGTEKVRAFQRLACGLGIGASINPRWGFTVFDPRVETIDETSLFPVPGGYSYSPDRGLSVTAIKEVD